MNKTVLASALALAINSASTSVIANDDFQLDYRTPTNENAEIATLKEGVSFGAAAIVGGLVAGPIGVMAGAIGGVLLGGELNKADQYQEAADKLTLKEKELAGVQTEIVALKDRLLVLQDKKEKMEALAINDLEFQLLFHTGNDTLDEEAMRRLDNLAAFLLRNPELNVRLHGHADPRGTDGYNNVLSQHRALNVKSALEFYGVEPERVESYSYGANKSTAIKGDLDAYALERKVTVQVIKKEESGNELAAIK